MTPNKANPADGIRRFTSVPPLIRRRLPHEATMSPGQPTLTAFEAAILERLVAKEPRLAQSCTGLHVLSREFTGVGSYTSFLCDDSIEGDDWHLTLDALIVVPGVENGMGAVLFGSGKHPKVLETFTYGDDQWDGVYDGFSVEEAG